MRTSASPPAPRVESRSDSLARGDLALFLAASRFHIVLIAGLGTLTFGWLFAGVHDPWVSILSALDWWILDVGNKLSDLSEDRVNSPEQARWVERNARWLTSACFAVFAASLVPTVLCDPWLIPWRIAFQVVGVFYNFRLLPGGRRFKSLYFWKNSMAGVLFLMSVVGYPILALREQIQLAPAAIVLLAAFFFFLEHSFEVTYDFKDIAGDRAHGVRTYPAVHGPRVGAAVFHAAVFLSAAMLIAGIISGVLRFEDGLLLFAPAVQFVAFRFYSARGYRAGDTVMLTHLGSLQLLAYNVYLWLELPIPPW